MKYSIVITTYNHVDDLLKPCIESIVRNTIIEDMEIIIVANGCTDHTREYVESLGEPFKLLWFDEPLGYTKAANEGFKIAQGEYIIPMNNDVEILDFWEKNQWLEALEAPFFIDEKVAVTGVSRLFNESTRRYFIIFFLAMLKREIFEKYGFYDETFSPGWGEDIDYCHKIEDDGYKCVKVPDDTYEWTYSIPFPVVHKDGQTMKQDGSVWVNTYDKTAVEHSEILRQRHFKPIKYSIIIPTYNHLDDLLKPCIESIRENTDFLKKCTEVIVIANGCTDETAAYVRSLGYPFRLLDFQEPLGYTKATNEGIKAAEGEYLILLNNDTKILPFPELEKGDWIEMLEHPFIQDDKMGLTGPMQSYCPHAEDDFIIFFCCMIPKRLFDELGLLDEIFSPGFGEDSVTGETPIIIKRDGEIDIIPIEDIYASNEDGRVLVENVEVFTASGWSKLNYCYRHSVSKPIYRIRTSSSQINVTGDHSLFSGGIPVLVSDLKIGDKIDLIKENPILLDGFDITDSWEQGMFVAEGSASINKYRIKRRGRKNEYDQTVAYAKIDQFGKDSEHIIDRICETWNWNKKQYKTDEKSNHDIYYRTSLTGVNKQEKVLELRNKYYTNTSSEKKVPVEILNSNKKSIESFLDGYFTGDGHEEHREKRRSKKSYTTKSATLAFGVQLLWERLGVFSSINVRKDKPHIFNVRELIGKSGIGTKFENSGIEPKKDDGTIIEISIVTELYRDDNGKCHVYDVNTDDGTFIAGVGGVVAHNTDFAMRAKQAGYKIEQVPNYDVSFLDQEQKRMSGSFPIFHAGEETFKHIENGDDLLQKNREILAQRWGKKNRILVPENNELKKLNLGCGDLTLDGYVNVDLYNPQADLKADIQDLSMFPDGSVGEILAYHVFEHINPYQVHAMLHEWNRILCDGGRLMIELPDIEGMCKEFTTANKAKRYELLNCIYGTTQIEHPHLFGWYEEIMRDHLTDTGFVDVVKKDPEIKGHWGVNMRIEAQKPARITSDPDKTKDQEDDENQSRIYDGFLFSNELDLLEVRLNELYDVVDKFIIVESPKTHTNMDKPLLFEQNKERYARFMDKIVHIVASDYPEWHGNPWDYERHQRHSISKGWTNLRDHDIVMVSDLDEIPSKEAVKNYKVSDGFRTFQQTLSYYKLNCICTSQKWEWGKILPYSIAKTMDGPCHIRYTESPIIPNGGWHFSYAGDVRFIQKKLAEFSHWEYNNEEYNTEDVISHRMENGLDLFGRDIQFSFVDIDESFPQYVRENLNAMIKNGLVQTNRRIDRTAVEALDVATFYEVFLLNSYAIYPRDMKDKIVIDVGANRGIFSLYAYESGARLIIAFEPQEDNFNMLKDNCSQYPEIEIHQVAVVGIPIDYIDIYGEDVVASIYQNQESPKSSQRVRAVVLSDCLKGIDGNDLVLKMDCEASEYDIMMNTPRDIIRRFKTIVMEIHDAIEPFIGKSKELKNMIVSMGYSAVSEFAFGTWYDLENGEKSFVPGLASIIRFNRNEE